MNFDRAEWTGTGAAVVFHVALIAALSMSLASVDHSPEPPSMEVELVEEVGLQSAAPVPVHSARSKFIAAPRRRRRGRHG